MDIDKREWQVNPPKEPMTSLAAIVRDYEWRFPREKRDMVWEWCRTAPGLGVAIKRACDSRGADGKMHNHQSRVTAAARNEFAVRITGESRKIRSIARMVYQEPIKQTYLEKMERTAYTKGERPIPDSRFDALHDLLDDLKPAGIGPVTLYDVATRIGAYLEIEPTSLYVHAGVRIGLKALCWSMPERINVVPLGFYEPWHSERVPARLLHKWWPEFEDLPPDEVEDLLCTYRGVFDFGTAEDRGGVKG